MSVVINTPEETSHLYSPYMRTYEALKTRGFNNSTCDFWACIYCSKFIVDTEELSEAVIETFGTNLLHSGNNITHFAEKLKEYGMTFRAEQLVNAINDTEVANF